MFCPLFVDQIQTFCALLMHHSFSCRLFSRDITAWLFCLYWILFPEMSQLIISSLLEVYPNVLCSPRAPRLLCRLFSRDVTAWLFRLYSILFPEMSQLVISSLLEVTQMICALLVHHSLSCRLFSRDVTAWLFCLYRILFPEMSNWIFRLSWRFSKCFVLSSCTTVSLVDSSPEMLPPGYFVFTGSCFQRCPNWLFRLSLRFSKCLCFPRAPQSLL